MTRTNVGWIRLHAFRSGPRISSAGDFEVRGPVWLRGQGTVHIGRGVRLLAERAPIELHAHTGASVHLDEGVVVEGGTSIEATLSIRVGARTTIGPFCKLMDNDFHTAGDPLTRPAGMPVIVGADVVMGPRAILLRGSEIGPGARIAPGAVVSFRVPANTTAR
jgi:acetyltransferase-like isoleucine patch superfamily enzyme